MLIAGGWTYNSIIATKPELEKKIGTELDAGRPVAARTRRSRAAATSCSSRSPRTRTWARAFVDFMLEPAQLNKFTSEIGFLPGTTDGIKASGYLEDPQRKPFAEQLLDHSAVYPPSPKWGGLEGANIFDGEIQKVMKGQATGAAGRGRARQEDGRGVRRVSSAPAAVSAGRARAPRPPATAIARRAVARLTLPVLLLLPALIIIVGLVGYPLVRTVYLSFTDTGLGELIYGGSTWVGLDNFKEVFADEHLRASLVNTVVFGTACVIGTMVFGFAVALLLNQRLRGNWFFAIAVLLPWAVPALAASAIWKWLFDSRYGFVNWALVELGFDGFQDYAWFAGRFSAYVAIFVTVVWQSFPFIALGAAGRAADDPEGDAARRRGRRRRPRGSASGW